MPVVYLQRIRGWGIFGTLGLAFLALTVPEPAVGAEDAQPSSAPPESADASDNSGDASAPVDASDASDDSDASDASDDSSEDLTVSTTVDETEDRNDPRFPSGWVTRFTPDGAFGRGRDLGDGIDEVGGVSVRQRSSLGQPSFATVRGGNPRQLDVYLNGIAIGAPAGIGFDIGGLSTTWIDDVDIYRGAAAAPYGSGALTGAIDIHARPPAETGWETGATTMGGSFETVGMSGGAASSSETLGLEVDASWRSARGDFQFLDDQQTLHTRINNGHRQLSLAATAGARLDAGDLSATLLYEDRHRGAPGPSEFQAAYRQARVDASRAVAVADWSKKEIAAGSWGALDARAAAGYVGRRLTYANPEPYLGGEAYRSTSNHDAVSVTAGLSGYLAFGDLFHLTLEGRTDRYRAEGDGPSTANFSVDRQSVALGGANELLLADGDLSLIGGLRAELVDGRRGATVPLVPSAGLIWRAADMLSLKANVARTFRVPDFDELYLQTETVRGNPNLDPERALSVDAGVSVTPDELPVSGRLAVFWRDTRNLILFLPKTAYLFEAQNLSGAVSRGLEASARLNLEKRYRVRTTYTLTDAHLDAVPSVQLARQPRHQGSVSSRVELAGLGALDKLHSLRLTGGFDIRSKVNLDNAGNLSNPPFWQIDLGATVAPTRSLELGVEVRNVTDNRRGADHLQRPLPGRAVYGSMRVRTGNLNKESD